MRIHIGRISPALANNVGELEKRLKSHGALQSPISLHRKEHGEFYFAYVDMDLDEKKFQALCSALNGLMFKQSKLTIQPAQPDFTEKLASERKQHIPKYNPEQLRRLRARKPAETDVFHARERTAPAPREDITFRVMIKGRLHKPKPRKRKLWGVERRPLAKLVSHFVDGEWRDSEGKAVEVVSALHDEHARDQRIAEAFAAQTGYLSDSDFDEFQEQKAALEATNVSDEEIEIVPRSNAPLAPRVELDSDMEIDEGDNIDGKAPVTESLRTALSADKPFTLFGDALEAPVAAHKPAEPVAVPAPAPEYSEPKVGLFFDHRHSPYLRSQTQAAKFVTDFDPAAWEAAFWENRGEWNRALRRRRKDAAKLARKSSKWY